MAKIEPKITRPANEIIGTSDGQIPHWGSGPERVLRAQLARGEINYQIFRIKLAEIQNKFTAGKN